MIQKQSLNNRLVWLVGLFCLFLVVPFLPNPTWMAWQGFHFVKIIKLILALSLVQIVGDVLVHTLGSRAGAVLTGFFGGLISSTAVTVSLSKSNSATSNPSATLSAITLLSATLGMIMEAWIILLLGLKNISPHFLILFSGPVLVTLILLGAFSRNQSNKSSAVLQSLNFKSILKLTFFILTLLILTKVVQDFLGNISLRWFTFLASLFEMHATLIATTQAFQAEMFSDLEFGHLLTLILLASYTSKLFIVMFSKNKKFRRLALISLTLIILSLLCGALFLNIK